MRTEIELATTFCDQAVIALNAGELTAEDAANGQVVVQRATRQGGGPSLQLHGGYGYMLEYPIARAYADARVTRMYGGTTEIMKEIVGRSRDLIPSVIPTVRRSVERVSRVRAGSAEPLRRGGRTAQRRVTTRGRARA